MRHRCLAALTICILLAARAAGGEADDALKSYRKTEVAGFSVLVNKEVDAHEAESKAAMAQLQKQLEEVTRALPGGVVGQLREVPIWVEWEKKKGGAAEFHPSKGWLVANGYPAIKARSVEISNVRNFVNWSQRTQPSMVLHELAHAYHFRVLGDDHRGVEAAYRQAVERKLYDSVPFITGGKRKAYALTNSREYFAEISEAYWGKNDFFPFTRDELRDHDPVGYKLMEEVWNREPEGRRNSGLGTRCSGLGVRDSVFGVRCSVTGADNW